MTDRIPRKLKKRQHKSEARWFPAAVGKVLDRLAALYGLTRIMSKDRRRKESDDRLRARTSQAREAHTFTGTYRAFMMHTLITTHYPSSIVYIDGV